VGKPRERRSGRPPCIWPSARAWSVAADNDEFRRPLHEMHRGGPVPDIRDLVSVVRLSVVRLVTVGGCRQPEPLEGLDVQVWYDPREQA
jgi:hypothetical protein